jgi:hypothetical protein
MTRGKQGQSAGKHGRVLYAGQALRAPTSALALRHALHRLHGLGQMVHPVSPHRPQRPLPLNPAVEFLAKTHP